MKLLKLISSLLPPLFWGLIIFGFEEPCLAFATLLCTVIHEVGHLLFTPGSRLRGVLSGFRIQGGAVGSYKQRILTYLGGPLANIIASIIFLALSSLAKDYFLMLALINLATALSNLVPIEGYDGYGIILSIIEMRELDERFHRALLGVSNTLILLLCVFSLCLIDRMNGGYWIFAIFFTLMIKGISRDLSKRFSSI